MPSLIDLRRRIRSVKSTQQVTKAMKMVSAAKLRRAQDRALDARPYAAIFRQVLGDVAAAALAGDEQLAAHPLLAQRPEKRILVVLLTADRGLAGAFNSNLIKTTQQFLREHEDAETLLYTIGRKGRDFFRKRGAQIVAEKTGISQTARFSDAAEVAADARRRFEECEVDAVYLIYNEFKSVMAQKLTVLKVLPVEVPAGSGGRDYIYEQPAQQLLNGLLPRYVEIVVYQAMLESAAAEHAARMTAMEAATTNAEEMIDKLTLYMNRVRQASITKELIEVVSGAAAQM
ncbi:MAG TPA: ATP synthase F1 subunit gamma [Bryobacteraceae bacterium]|nr:ATP synthase F1 subunit gamma [Bryobacteraceae bacterium]HOQ47503.1 ATP synthase F1 subunit gamma [Bryobacteraceae bacterium]HPQ16760.1 ATP synthase F1 subunit gamma [Bryobacteraceae bacterium]HPU71480.1 ATP synthase F1 subunit gamma [Bryobacteraceae bacterium]